MTDHAIVHVDAVADAYAGTDVPGDFRRLTDVLGCRQLATSRSSCGRSRGSSGARTR